MKKRWGLGFTGILLVGILAGCGAAEQEEASGTSTVETVEQEQQGDNAAGEATEIMAWHDNDDVMMNALAEIVNKKLKEENIVLKFEKKSDVTGQIRLYGTDSKNGPDMYLFAHDSLGSFAEMGILEPVNNLISQEKQQDLLPMTIQAATYDGQQYLMPVYYETLLFLYNKELWEGEVPSTTEALYDYMVSHTDTSAGTYALVNQHSNAYNISPFIYGFGGFVINEEALPGLNDPATMEAINYNKKFAALQADGDYNTVTALFNEKKAAAILGGPWLISGIKEAGISLGYKSLADFTLPNGNSLKPFSGVQCLGVLKYAAESKKEALVKVLEVLAEPEVGIRLAKDFNCAPANMKAYEDTEVANNEMILVMKKTAEVAVPMPNVPEMGAMWGPSEAFFTAVNKAGEDVNTIAENYQNDALSAIADMK